MASGLKGKDKAQTGTVQPMNLQGLSTVAFDLDGTLCFYTVSVQEAIAETLDRLGRPVDLVGDLDRAASRYNELWYEVELNRGPVMSIRAQIWVRLLAEHGVNDTVLAHELVEEYTRIRVPSIQLFDGARDLLLDLKRTYRLGLLTNGPTDMQWPKIENLRIAPLFDAIVVSGDVGIYKPDARVFDILLGRLGTTPQEVLYVGDSHRMDVVGAKGAGMWSAWVRTPHGAVKLTPWDKDGEEAVEVTPDIEVSGVGELREVLL